MEELETESHLSSWTHVGHTGFQQAPGDGLTDYEPSILSEFAGFLPHVTSDGLESFPEDYNADRVVQAAWKALPNKELELQWESDFWNRFLDPNVSALDMMSKVHELDRCCSLVCNRPLFCKTQNTLFLILGLCPFLVLHRVILLWPPFWVKLWCFILTAVFSFFAMWRFSLL